MKNLHHVLQSVPGIIKITSEYVELQMKKILAEACFVHVFFFFFILGKQFLINYISMVHKKKTRRRRMNESSPRLKRRWVHELVVNDKKKKTSRQNSRVRFKESFAQEKKKKMLQLNKFWCAILRLNFFVLLSFFREEFFRGFFVCVWVRWRDNKVAKCTI